MSRVQLLLGALIALLLVVLFWLLLWSPQQDELAAIEDDIDAALAEQERLSTERDQLREVRDQAPEVEATLVAADSIVPRDAALPSALRQLQQAADDAGATLRSVAPARPAQVEAAAEGVSRIDVALQVEGSYFQLVDFLRRVEEPSLSPRALVWSNLAIQRDEYPQLSASLTGSMFAELPAPPPDEPDEVEDDQDADLGEDD